MAAADIPWLRSRAGRIGPPSRLLLMLEARALSELGAFYLSRPLLRSAPRGDGHPVLVLPGFLASDFSTTPLRSFLSSRGYAAEGWKLGRNLGASGLEDRLLERVAALRRRHGRKVSLVGWSLGGIFAREVARLASDDVRSVITLGSPFNHDPRANHSWRLFEYLSGRTIDGIDARVMAGMREPPPVPATAIYSRSDGIVAWRCCVEREGPASESIEVEGSHLGLGHNPLVLHAVADRLAQPEGVWRRFERRGFRRYFYRDPLR